MTGGDADESSPAAVRFPAGLLLAAASGLLLGASFPPVSWWPLASIAIVPLIVCAVRARSGFHAFLYGSVSLMISWLMTMSWVIVVMSRYGGLSELTGIALYVAMTLVLALYGGGFAWIVWRLRPMRFAAGWVLVPLAWTVSEFARTHLLSGFPWHLLATTTIDLPQFALTAAWIGPYGTGALLVSISAVLAHLILVRMTVRRRIIELAALVVSIGVILTAGHIGVGRRLQIMGQEQKHAAAMIQPNIAQEMRWDAEQTFEIFERMLRLTTAAERAGAEVIVWPESTVPLAFYSTPFYRAEVERLSRESGADIILGSVAEDEQDPGAIWNSAYLVHGGQSSGRYDKIRLVPFGEYVPLRKVLFFAERLVRAVGEFRFGERSEPLRGKWAYGPAICYEVVFPQIVRDQVRHGASVLVTITNDAWFGGETAPVQHLRAVRLRAIETDRWFLRAATTGISALIDPAGRIVDSLPMDQQGIVYGRFGVRSNATLYVRFGDWFAIASCIVIGLVLIVRRKVMP